MVVCVAVDVAVVMVVFWVVVVLFLVLVVVVVEVLCESSLVSDVSCFQDQPHRESKEGP